MTEHWDFWGQYELSLTISDSSHLQSLLSALADLAGAPEPRFNTIGGLHAAAGTVGNGSILALFAPDLGKDVTAGRVLLERESPIPEVVTITLGGPSLTFYSLHYAAGDWSLEILEGLPNLTLADLSWMPSAPATPPTFTPTATRTPCPTCEPTMAVTVPVSALTTPCPACPAPKVETVVVLIAPEETCTPYYLVQTATPTPTPDGFVHFLGLAGMRNNFRLLVFRLTCVPILILLGVGLFSWWLLRRAHPEQKISRQARKAKRKLKRDSAAFIKIMDDTTSTAMEHYEGIVNSMSNVFRRDFLVSSILFMASPDLPEGPSTRLEDGLFGHPPYGRVAVAGYKINVACAISQAIQREKDEKEILTWLWWILSRTKKENAAIIADLLQTISRNIEIVCSKVIEREKRAVELAAKSRVRLALFRIQCWLRGNRTSSALASKITSLNSTLNHFILLLKSDGVDSAWIAQWLGEGVCSSSPRFEGLQQWGGTVGKAMFALYSQLWYASNARRVAADLSTAIGKIIVDDLVSLPGGDADDVYIYLKGLFEALRANSSLVSFETDCKELPYVHYLVIDRVFWG